MKKITGTAFLIVLVSWAMPAQARTPAELIYFLPKVKVAASVSQTLVGCPDVKESAGDPHGLEILYDVQIVPKASPDRPVVVDGSGGFLVDRKTKITLAEDGTLKSFNGSSEGQGGPFLSSLVKVAATAYGLSVAPLPTGPGTTTNANKTFMKPPRNQVRRVVGYRLGCTTDTEKLVKKLTALDGEIADLETRVAQGTNSPASDALLRQRKAESVALAERLTITAQVALAPSPDGQASTLIGKSDPTKFDTWLTVLPIEDLVPPNYQPPTKPSLEAAIATYLGKQHPTSTLVGQHGYQLQIVPDAAMQTWLGCGSAAGQKACSNLDREATPIRTRNLYYRRPVPATVKLIALDQRCTKMPCPDPKDDWTQGGAVSSKQSIKLPQLSRLYTLPTGGGGIFGSRSVGAEFGGFGEPLMLSYERGSASGDVASVLSAGAEAAESIDKARLEATTSRIDRIKARRELEDLLAATP